MPDQRPTLRYLDLLPAQQDGHPIIALRDPTGYSDLSLAVSHTVLLLMKHMDGTNDLRDIQAAFLRETSTLLPMEQIEGLVEALDDALFLENERFEAHRGTVDADYLGQLFRPAAHAGASYPDDPEELDAFLAGFYTHHAGPGGAPGEPNGHSSPVRALIAPHIDYHRGGPGYAHAYRALAEGTKARCFIIFGTSHYGCEGLFGLTHMGYDTPLGPVPCDVDMLDEIVRRADGEEWFAGEMAHRTEHSIEFQAVYLRHLYPDDPDLRIVPILCGSLHDWVAGRSSPGEDARVAAMIDAVRSVIAEQDDPTVVIAAADLAHVGPKFGDPEPLTEDEVEALDTDDNASLEHVLRGDADAFFLDIADDDDQRRICGLAPIYMTLKTVAPSSGRLLQYGQAEDPTGPSVVSFASLTLR